MRTVLMAGAMALTAMVAGCANGVQVPRVQPAAQQTFGLDVVHSTGVGDARIGDTKAALKAKLATARGTCAEQLSGVPDANLVFDSAEKLALIWFENPLRTPEGIGNGSNVSQVSQAYQGVTELQAPAGSNRFSGLLVSNGDQGYLFLHDGTTVRKSIAGNADYLRLLFSSGFGVC